MTVTDDGEVTRASFRLDRVSDALLFAAMDEVMLENARRRFGKDARSDGEATFFHDGETRAGASFTVDARPGRSAGGWWWFVARVEQDGVEHAHLERRLQPRA